MRNLPLVIKRRKIITNAVYGFLLGLFFPIIGTAFELSKSGANLSFSSIRGVHFGQPLMLVINAAPIILSASFALIGIQATRAYEAIIKLNEWKTEQEIQTQNEHHFLEALISSTSFAVVRLDTNHHVITCNKAFENLFGYTCEEIIGKHIDDLITPDEYHKEVSRMTDSISDGNLVRKISKRMRKDGELVDVEIVGVPVTAAGEKIGILGLYHDISLRKQTEQALLESEARFKSLFNESPISLWEEDFSEVKRILEKVGDKEQILEQLNKDYSLVMECTLAVKILNINQATVDLYNAKSKAELIQGLAEVLVLESMEEFKQELIALLNGVTSYECEIYQKKLTGELIYGWLRLSVPPGFEDTWERVHISIIDITERKEAEEKLRFMSFHDALTGLYNRAYFEEEMDRLGSSRQFPVSMIACDLDGLKQINDLQGHDVGDQAIKAAAKILRADVFRKEDVVARTGGDEFVILLPSVDIKENPSILQRLERSIRVFNQSDEDDGLYRPISLSYGYAVIPPGGSLEEGFKLADGEMYSNKQKKKEK
jgi:diguanylate cyclase (GGDEF)-like protein/PAS domain S-box-containing protein